jgi:hypothetical protein
MMDRHYASTTCRASRSTDHANYNIPLSRTINHVYELPGAKQWGRLNNLVTRVLFNGWQLSGLTNIRDGTPYSLGFSVPNYGAARVWLIGDLLTGTTDSPYNRLNPAAFRPAPVGSIGIDSPRIYLVGPGADNRQMAVQRNIAITEKTSLQLRVEAFNVFNHTQFSGINSQINFKGINDPTPTNLPFDASGNLTNK